MNKKFSPVNFIPPWFSMLIMTSVMSDRLVGGYTLEL
jgi:hypothetical protein